MKNVNEITDRLLYLGNEFKIFEQSEVETFIEELSDNTDIKMLNSMSTNSVLAFKKSTLNNNEKGRFKVTIHVSSDVFSDMIKADPTENKEYLQWMLNVFRNMIKDENISNEKARQFAEEDLKMANTYLTIFSRNKYKKKFKELCLNTIGTPKTDPSNINQYTSLSQLFDAVFPFIEREPSLLENKMIEFEKKGEAKIAFRDRKWTVYIPYTVNANCVMETFASWCTAKPGNSNFGSYTSDYKLPNGKKSNIYVIISNLLFEGKSKECYQIHFESRQVKTRINDGNVDIYSPVLSTSDGISDFFKMELTNLASLIKDDTNNIYRDFLIKFGFSDALFEMLDPKLPIISFQNKKDVNENKRITIPKLPDLTRFSNNLDELTLVNVNLKTIPASIGALKNLLLLSLPFNDIKSLPSEIGNLKKIEYINLKGNKIESIPDEIKNLDSSNGGSLYKIAINEQDVNKDTFNRLRKLLPNVILG
jgi:leucine-rich repeat protein SHOC2